MIPAPPLSTSPDNVADNPTVANGSPVRESENYSPERSSFAIDNTARTPRSSSGGAHPRVAFAPTALSTSDESNNRISEGVSAARRTEPREPLASIECHKTNNIYQFVETIPPQLELRMANSVFTVRIQQLNKVLSAKRLRSLNDYSILWYLLLMAYVVLGVTISSALKLPDTSPWNIVIVAGLVPFGVVCHYCSRRPPKYIKQLKIILDEWNIQDSSQRVVYVLQWSAVRGTMFKATMQVDVYDGVDYLAMGDLNWSRTSTVSRFGRPSFGLPRYQSRAPSYEINAPH
ncbi:hypothetical protein BDR26DRAFT_893145 [Obelidium mucronatum]|nr:hypothetical protein BDR26DRAFT_893145 [Obelidium mucronatum]